MPSKSATRIPATPDVTTSFSIIASGINVNLPELSSNPKKPVFAIPSYQLKAIPLSLLSSVVGAPLPRVIIGSSIVTAVELTVVVVPLTVKLPLTLTF